MSSQWMLLSVYIRERQRSTKNYFCFRFRSNIKQPLQNNIVCRYVIYISRCPYWYPQYLSTVTAFKRQESKYLKCVNMIVIYCEIVSLHFYFLQTSCTASEHTLITLHMISQFHSVYIRRHYLRTLSLNNTCSSHKQNCWTLNIC